MRALLVVFGTRGDVQPTLALAHGLRAAGHDVEVAAPPANAAWVASLGFAFTPCGPDFDDVLRDMGPRLFQQALRAQFALVDHARAADVIVGAGLVFAGRSLGEAAGVPYAFAAYAPQPLPSRHHDAPVFPRPLPAWSRRVGWWFVRWTWNAAFRGRLNRERAALGLGPVDDVWTELLGDAPLLAWDDALAPVPDDAPADAVPCGAWILPPAEELAPDVEDFLRAGPPPVYIGFGSMVDRRPTGTTKLVVDALAMAGARGLVSSGWAQLGGGALPSTVRAIGPAPHARLFPRCAAVVHHGGAGTTTTTARAGVPQVVVPHIFDQHQWAAAVARAGIGPAPIRRGALTARALADAIRACADDGVRARARDFAARTRDDGVARAVAHLEARYRVRMTSVLST